MKSKEELNALKEEVETVSKKLHELTEEELTQVSGGIDLPGSGGFDPVLDLEPGFRGARLPTSTEAELLIE